MTPTPPNPAPRVAGWQQGWILVIAGFLPVMAIVALAPTLPTLLAHFHGIVNPQIAVPLLITAPSACIALLAPLAGVMTDRFGRRNLLIAAMACYGVGGIVPFIADDFWVVIASRLIIGVAEAAILTVTNTLLGDYFDEERRHRWLTIQGVMGSVLGSAVMACSGFLAARGWQWPFAVYAIAFPILIASLVYLYEPAPRAKAARGSIDAADAGPFPWRVAALLCGVTAVLATIYFVQVINFSLVLKQLGVDDPRKIGLIMAIPSLGVPIGSLVFKFTTRFGPLRQIALVLASYAVGLTGIGLATDYRTALGFAFMQQLANGIVVPALIAWATSCYAFVHRGRGMGLWASAFFIAQFLSPAVVALVGARAGGLQPAFTAFGVLSVVLCAGVLWLRRRDAAHPASLASSATL